jgi:DNA-binding transcriptional LysR family regulator
MNSDQLEQFRVIAESGSLTKAASILYISQPALSKTLKNLETELGCKLFFRSGKKLNITKEGQRLLEYATTVFTTIDNAQQELKCRDDKKGTRIFGIGYYLPELLAGYYDENSFNLDLQVIPDDLIPNMLMNKHADMIIADDYYLRHYGAQGLEKVLLFQEQLLLNIPSNHRLFFREWIPLNEIQGEPLLYIDMKADIDSWIKEILKINHCKLNIKLRLDPLLFQQIRNNMPYAFLVSSSTHLFNNNQEVTKGWKKIRINALYSSRYIYLWYYKRDFRRLAGIIETIKDNAVKAAANFEYPRTLA